ncbi:hypothetical protein AAMO2058_000733000 [Amorphochlora amoebiformis]
MQIAEIFSQIICVTHVSHAASEPRRMPSPVKRRKRGFTHRKRRGRPPSHKAKYVDDKTDLLVAEIAGEAREEKIRELLNGKADPNARHDTIPIFNLLVERDKYEAVKLLLDAGCNVDAAWEKGMNALICAAKSGDIKRVKFLVEVCGASPYSCTMDGNTALCHAVRAGKPNVINYLDKFINKTSGVFHQQYITEIADETLETISKIFSVDPKDLLRLNKKTLGLSNVKQKLKRDTTVFVRLLNFGVRNASTSSNADKEGKNRHEPRTDMKLEMIPKGQGERITRKSARTRAIGRSKRSSQASALASTFAKPTSSTSSSTRTRGLRAQEQAQQKALSNPKGVEREEKREEGQEERGEGKEERGKGDEKGGESEEEGEEEQGHGGEEEGGKEQGDAGEEEGGEEDEEGEEEEGGKSEEGGGESEEGGGEGAGVVDLRDGAEVEPMEQMVKSGEGKETLDPSPSHNRLAPRARRHTRRVLRNKVPMGKNGKETLPPSHANNRPSPRRNTRRSARNKVLAVKPLEEEKLTHTSKSPNELLEKRSTDTSLPMAVLEDETLTNTLQPMNEENRGGNEVKISASSYLAQQDISKISAGVAMAVMNSLLPTINEMKRERLDLKEKVFEQEKRVETLTTRNQRMMETLTSIQSSQNNLVSELLHRKTMSALKRIERTEEKSKDVTMNPERLDHITTNLEQVSRDHNAILKELKNLQRVSTDSNPMKILGEIKRSLERVSSDHSTIIAELKKLQQISEDRNAMKTLQEVKTNLELVAGHHSAILTKFKHHFSDKSTSQMLGEVKTNLQKISGDVQNLQQSKLSVLGGIEGLKTVIDKIYRAQENLNHVSSELDTKFTGFTDEFNFKSTSDSKDVADELKVLREGNTTIQETLKDLHDMSEKIAKKTDQIQPQPKSKTKSKSKLKSKSSKAKKRMKNKNMPGKTSKSAKRPRVQMEDKGSNHKSQNFVDASQMKSAIAEPLKKKLKTRSTTGQSETKRNGSQANPISTVDPGIASSSTPQLIRKGGLPEVTVSPIHSEPPKTEEKAASSPTMTPKTKRKDKKRDSVSVSMLKDDFNAMIKDSSPSLGSSQNADENSRQLSFFELKKRLKTRGSPGSNHRKEPDSGFLGADETTERGEETMLSIISKQDEGDLSQEDSNLSDDGESVELPTQNPRVQTPIAGRKKALELQAQNRDKDDEDEDEDVDEDEDEEENGLFSLSQDETRMFGRNVDTKIGRNKTSITTRQPNHSVYRPQKRLASMIKPMKKMRKRLKPPG